jgi:hypothetical protein
VDYRKERGGKRSRPVVGQLSGITAEKDQSRKNKKGEEKNMGRQTGAQKAPQKTVSKGGPSKVQPAATTTALETLRSVHFFSLLRGALQSVGLTGWEQRAGIGVYVTAVSASQAYPLRVQIQETKEGTTAYILQKVENLLVPGSMVTIRPDDEKQWAQFAESPNGKLVVIPEMEVHTKEGTTRLDVLGDRIVRTAPRKVDGRVVEKYREVLGRFACISEDRPRWDLRRPRWLTMKQPERQDGRPGVGGSIDLDRWHEVGRLLQQRAQLPVVLPEWEQDFLELISEKKDDRGLKNLPALLQLWRTMCVIQSFQTMKNDEASVLEATIEDLAAATLLRKDVFREAFSFPSISQLLTRRPILGEVSVMNPVTGKGQRFGRHHKKEDTAQYSLPFDDSGTSEADSEEE